MSRDALVVGINSYASLSNLSAPSEDAEAIAQRLEQDGDFQVKRLPETVKDGKLQVGKQTQVT
ncbi:caspase family protein, partial [Leptolyngbya sp. FACHB-671]|uniref:caspase family protein n=1 Tax=Leptolyngbya sp. FACHB-671 TaxID=2692812 RepID=UPI001683B713